MRKHLLCGYFILLPWYGYMQTTTIDSATLQTIKAKLEHLSDMDQQYRTISNLNKLNSLRKFGLHSTEYTAIQNLIASNDSSDQREIIPILDKYGWLGQSEVGEKANESIFYIIHHSNNELRLKYIPLMRASVAKGESNRTHLEWMEDRILLYQDKPQKYGTQPYNVPRKDGSIDFYTDRHRANEELLKEGLDTTPSPLLK